jgi:hypothetical protein
MSSIRTAVATVAVLLIAGATNVFACPMCFAADETSMIDGAKTGVLVMLAVTLVVQGAFAAFFFYLRKHAKRNADIELEDEWLELQRASKP